MGRDNPRQPTPDEGMERKLIDWAELTVGAVIRYEHLSRAKRLANRPLTIRRGRIESINPNINYGKGQITVSTLNKDGTVNAHLGRVYLHGRDLILGVETPATAVDVASSQSGGDHDHRSAGA